MKNLKLASVVVLLLVLLFTTVSAVEGPIPHGVGQLFVFDANGKKVAPVIDFSSRVGLVFFGIDFPYPNIAIQVDDQLLVLGVTRDGFAGSIPTARVFFESTDCTGTPLFDFDPIAAFAYAGRMVPASIVLSDGRVYVVDPTGPAQFSTTGHSFLEPNGTPTCQQIDQPMNAVHAKVLINLNQHFQPPFNVRSAGRPNDD